MSTRMNQSKKRYSVWIVCWTETQMYNEFLSKLSVSTVLVYNMY